MSRKDPHLSDRLALSVPEAAAAIGVSERHFRSVMSEVPHCRVGTRVVIPIDSFRDWLRTRAQIEGNHVDATVDEILSEIVDQ